MPYIRKLYRLHKAWIIFSTNRKNIKKNNLIKGERIAVHNLKNDGTIDTKKADTNWNCVRLHNKSHNASKYSALLPIRFI